VDAAKRLEDINLISEKLLEQLQAPNSDLQDQLRVLQSEKDTVENEKQKQEQKVAELEVCSDFNSTLTEKSHASIATSVGRITADPDHNLQGARDRIQAETEERMRNTLEIELLQSGIREKEDEKNRIEAETEVRMRKEHELELFEAKKANEIELLNSGLKQKDDEIKAQAEKLSQIGEEIQAMISKVVPLEVKIRDDAEIINKLRHQLEKTTTELKDAKAEIKAMQTLQQDKDAGEDPTNGKLLQAQKQLELERAEREKLSRDQLYCTSVMRDTMEEERNRARSMEAKLTAQLCDAISQIGRQNSGAARLEAQLIEMTETCRILRNDKENSDDEITALRNDLVELRSAGTTRPNFSEEMMTSNRRLKHDKTVMSEKIAALKDDLVDIQSQPRPHRVEDFEATNDPKRYWYKDDYSVVTDALSPYAGSYGVNVHGWKTPYEARMLDPAGSKPITPIQAKTDQMIEVMWRADHPEAQTHMVTALPTDDETTLIQRMFLKAAFDIEKASLFTEERQPLSGLTLSELDFQSGDFLIMMFSSRS